MDTPPRGVQGRRRTWREPDCCGRHKESDRNRGDTTNCVPDTPHATRERPRVRSRDDDARGRKKGRLWFKRGKLGGVAARISRPEGVRARACEVRGVPLCACRDTHARRTHGLLRQRQPRVGGGGGQGIGVCIRGHVKTAVLATARGGRRVIVRVFEV